MYLERQISIFKWFLKDHAKDRSLQKISFAITRIKYILSDTKMSDIIIFIYCIFIK